jgi:hypothetical protein
MNIIVWLSVGSPLSTFQCPWDGWVPKQAKPISLMFKSNHTYSTFQGFNIAFDGRIVTVNQRSKARIKILLQNLRQIVQIVPEARTAWSISSQEMSPESTSLHDHFCAGYMIRKDISFRTIFRLEDFENLLNFSPLPDCRTHFILRLAEAFLSALHSKKVLRECFRNGVA